MTTHHYELSYIAALMAEIKQALIGVDHA